MPKKLKPIPKFENEAEECLFWETRDSFEYIDWDEAVLVQFPNLELTDRNESLESSDDSVAA